MPLKYKDKKGSTHSIEMEPSLIEAYLQMFGSMDKAALHMAEYSEYSIEKDRDGSQTKKVRLLIRDTGRRYAFTKRQWILRHHIVIV